MLTAAEASEKAALALAAAEEAAKEYEAVVETQIANHKTKTQALTAVVDKLRKTDPKAQKISLLGDEIEGYSVVMRIVPEALRHCGVNEKTKAEAFLSLIQKMFGTPGR